MPRPTPSFARSTVLPCLARGGARHVLVLIPALCACLGAAACGARVEKDPARSEPAAQGAGLTVRAPRPANCPERAQAKSQLPNTFPELSRLDYWLARNTPKELDEPLLAPDIARAHDVALRAAADGAPRSVDLT